jgi:hypothetical protein
VPSSTEGNSTKATVLRASTNDVPTATRTLAPLPAPTNDGDVILADSAGAATHVTSRSPTIGGRASPSASMACSRTHGNARASSAASDTRPPAPATTR